MILEMSSTRINFYIFLSFWKIFLCPCRYHRPCGALSLPMSVSPSVPSYICMSCIWFLLNNSKFYPSKSFEMYKMKTKFNFELTIFHSLSWRGVPDTALCDKVCQWLATVWLFSPSTLVSSANITDCLDITEILLKVALHPIKPNRVAQWIRLV
jgi:hypothetical protein